MASNTRTLADTSSGGAQFDDWFELYNPGTTSVELGGLFLTDDLLDPTHYLIPAGYSIPPGGRFLVWADGETAQNNTNRAELHVNFQLSKSGESIGLAGADGTWIDTVSFGAQTNDVSQGRYPDGAAQIVFMPVPTPGMANQIPGGNVAPVLAPIGIRTVYQGQILSFTATATDVDQPGQTLRFSLDAGAPAGAIVQAGTGIFQWPTAGWPAPSTNWITIRVADNGVPVLGDFEVVPLVVLAPPGFNSLQRVANQLLLGWPTLPGRTYRVEYSDTLAPGSWHAVGPDVIAGGNSLSLTVSLLTPQQRFYRVVALP
jgi:hypothetical protein